ncbi:class I SAM-dependent methyltransferase [Roseateles sp. PN1]|uniref:class I SAM-dependent methyltransferase n=1 Tax=Roseateles sp. PN1 TaxID=3137372 RepID=UPI0031391392
MRAFVKRIPVVGPIAQSMYRWLMPREQPSFANTGDYWQQRYTRGGNSGDGSYGKLAEFKAEILNAAVEEFGSASVIEFGCGDGNQLTLANYPAYTGIDISATAVGLCRERFAGDASKRFMALGDYVGEHADLALSLDVIYHLVEDGVYDAYLERLFSAAQRHVIIYSSNFERPATAQAPHVRHREFLRTIQQRYPEWALERHIANRYPFREEDGSGSTADFFFFAKRVQ